MDADKQFEISIPSDNDGYVLLRCEYCGGFFKCTPNEIETDELLNLYCPYCGLISENYYTDDVIELASAIIENYATDMLYDVFKSFEKGLSSKTFKFKAGKRPDHEYENPILSMIDDLEVKKYKCCNLSAKIKPTIKMSASFCPFCGVIEFDDE